MGAIRCSQVIDEIVSGGIVVVLAAGNDGMNRVSNNLTFVPNAQPLAWHEFKGPSLYVDDSITLTVALVWDNAANDLDLVILDADGEEICASRSHSGWGWWEKAWAGTIEDGDRFYEEVECRIKESDGYNTETYTVQVEGHSGQGEQTYEVWVSDNCEFTDPDPTYTIHAPASAKNAITVGNVNYANILNPTSSQGPSDAGLIKPEVVAPGTKICSAIPGDSYEHETGTSNGCTSCRRRCGINSRRCREK